MIRTPSGDLVEKSEYHRAIYKNNVPQTLYGIPQVVEALNDQSYQYQSAIIHHIKELEAEKNAELKEKDIQIQNIFAQLTETNNKFLDYLKEKDIQIQNIHAQLMETNNRFLDCLKEKDVQVQAQLKERDDQMKTQLKEKDEQICSLHDIISKMQTEKSTLHPPPCEEDDIQIDQNIPISSDVLPKIEENQNSSVVVTNIPETMIADDGKTILADNQIMESFIKNIHQNAKVVSVKRMGKKDSSKNRPIKVSFKTKNEKNAVLKNAPEYIKTQEKLKEWKVFVNNYEFPDAHKIQVKLTKKKDQLYKARGGNTTIKYFIKEKQIFVHDTPTNETKRVECEENMEAAQFYKRNQKSSQKETKNDLSS